MNNIGMNIGGMVKNITVNGVDHRQDKKNTIVDQGLKTLCELSTKSVVRGDHNSFRIPALLHGDFYSVVDSSHFYRAFPAVGCLFGTGDSPTSVDQTALESPIGNTEDLGYFGFHRSDLSYDTNFIVYDRYKQSEVHHLKYVWIATTDVTIKEIGIYSFLMPEEQITAGFTSAQINDLNNFTNRKLFSRCVLANPVNVGAGDTIVVYYDVTLSVPYLPGSILNTDPVFGMPAVCCYTDHNNFVCYANSKAVQQIDIKYKTNNQNAVIKNESVAESMLSELFKYNNVYKSATGWLNSFQVCENITEATGPVSTKPWTWDYIQSLYMGSAIGSTSGNTWRWLYTLGLTGGYSTHGIHRGSFEATVDGYSNKLHTVSNDFYDTYGINGTKRLVIICGNYQWFLNATYSTETGEITQSPATLPQNCSLTFDMTTSLNRE